MDKLALPEPAESMTMGRTAGSWVAPSAARGAGGGQGKAGTAPAPLGCPGQQRRVWAGGDH